MANFALAHAAGTAWKSICEECLAELAQHENESGFEKLGLVYISDHLAGDAKKIIALLRIKTGISDWVGSVGMGICATGHEYFDQPAIAILITDFPPDSFRLLETQESPGDLPASIADWARSRESRFGIVHADPRNGDILDIIAGLAESLDGFLVAGLTSSRGELAQSSGEVTSAGVSGVLLAGDVPVVTALSQTCMPMHRGARLPRVRIMSSSSSTAARRSTFSGKISANCWHAIYSASPATSLSPSPSPIPIPEIIWCGT